MPSAPALAVGAASVAAAAIMLAPGLNVPPVMMGANLLLSCACYLMTSKMSMAMRDTFIKARLFGIDLNKPETKRDANGVLVRPYQGPIIPEAMGAIGGTAYLVSMFCFIPFAFYDIGSAGLAAPPAAGAAPARSIWRGLDAGSGMAGPSADGFLLSKYLCGLLAICCMCFLGFADNVLDLRWRDKLWLPLTASLPLLMVYVVDGGGTVIVLPRAASRLLGLGSSVDIGAAYYAFMACLAIFCTNAINILAGVNGLEAGQSVVIAITIAMNNCIQLCRWSEGPLHANNLFSLCLILPFLAVSLALLRLNWHPARIFVGDTYCYFAGMTFAVCGILGHNAKTIANFVYSLPQLFKVIPCPRHRMPGYDRNTDRLVVSTVEFDEAELRPLGRIVLFLCEHLRLALVRRPPPAHGSAHAAGTPAVSRPVVLSNLTIINLALYLLGPMHEARLTTTLLGVQAVCSCVALFIRYWLAGLLYDTVY